MKKSILTISTLYLLTALSGTATFSAHPASFFPPELIRPAPITMAELAKRKTDGVSVAEVSDYVYGNYKGDFPSPPHADGNPKKAFIIYWKNFPFRFVFSHEASYCPWFELPSGAGLAYQFFEGLWNYEIFNQYGRQERNSFVDVIESGPKRVWIRWTYLGVKHNDPQPTYRGTEDFWAYPNGLILRRQTYQPIKPGFPAGQVIELIGLCPVGKMWSDVLEKSPTSEERHALAMLDPFSPKRRDVYWTPNPTPGAIWDSKHRQAGCTYDEITSSAQGMAFIIPMSNYAPFCVVGDASGFRREYTRLDDFTFNPEVGRRMGSSSFSHWPIGWTNSHLEGLTADLLQQYPNHFSTSGVDWKYDILPFEVQSRGVYYSLMGVADNNNLEAVRTVARRWLEKGTAAIIQPDSTADLPSPVVNHKQ